LEVRTHVLADGVPRTSGTSPTLRSSNRRRCNRAPPCGLPSATNPGPASLADHLADRHGGKSLENARVGWLLSRPSAAESSRMKWCWHGDLRPSHCGRISNSAPSIDWPTLEARPLALPRARPGRQHPADERDKSHSTFVEPAAGSPCGLTGGLAGGDRSQNRGDKTKPAPKQLAWGLVCD
jgi:hypothetical protein